MVDYSRATASRRAKDSFESTATGIHNQVSEFEESFLSSWTELEEYRKEMAAIIEHVIQIVKSCGIKPSKPLGQCNNQELNEEITRILPSLPFKEREDVQLSLIRINNRYELIMEKGVILEDIAQKLSKIAVPEKDLNEEVVLSLSDYKVNTEDVIEDLQRVESVTAASDELVQSLASLMETKKYRKEKDASMESFEKELKEIDTISLTDLEDSSLGNELTAEEVGSFYAKPWEDANNFEKQGEEIMRDDLKEPEYYEHAIKADQTVLAIAESVYGDKEFWEDIYTYGKNTSKIEQKAYEYNMTPEEACNMVGVLTGLTLQFPLEFTRENVLEVNDKLAK